MAATRLDALLRSSEHRAFEKGAMSRTLVMAMPWAPECDLIADRIMEADRFRPSVPSHNLLGEGFEPLDPASLRVDRALAAAAWAEMQAQVALKERNALEGRVAFLEATLRSLLTPADDVPTTAPELPLQLAERLSRELRDALGPIFQGLTCERDTDPDLGTVVDVTVLISENVERGDFRGVRKQVHQIFWAGLEGMDARAFVLHVKRCAAAAP